MSKRSIAIICGFFVALFYAYNFTAAKEVTPEHIGPFGLTWYRVIVTCAIFWVISLFAGKKEKVPLREFPLIALAAFCGVGFNMVTFMWGLSLTSPISASVLMVSTPIIVLVLSAIFLKERLFATRIIGILVGFSGAALLIFLSTGKGAEASNPLLGNALIFINAVSYAFYILLAKKLTAKYHVFTLMKWLYFFGVLFITPFGIVQGLDFEFAKASTETLLNIGYVILFATFGTYMLNIIAIRTLKPSVVAVFVYLQPLLATLIAVGLGKDMITWQKAVAGILIFTGVFLTGLKRDKKQLPYNKD
ncbi:EamA domain-containing membrane protein RarD [Nonlabens dokdonensis]|jgi:drug/metabolite transporter (DMT)-like permease|uniref:EamA domain-containing membrane protein RarD n=2 Tax=Nonlabens dokdonensis TaxID=328515 RepID=A0ABX5Q1U7_9FLAO|nr:DMT family transporter [Nonlabens dokdonensis]AGC76259.1 putative transmembrane permease [Nonlabens dokdonensis DSW-6]PZX43921.1 EamA domain-containing membrane protein RarD [Nonlabens dokdonensis]